jgi:hypothetical protein
MAGRVALSHDHAGPIANLPMNAKLFNAGA